MRLSVACLLASAAIVRAQVPFAFTNFAGMPGTSGSTNGTGGSARFSNPCGVALDSAGNLYVADRNNHTIRKITPAGVVTTPAGVAGQPGGNDATGNAAHFYYPFGVAVDSAGNVYIADSYNQAIRKMTPATVVTTLAGFAGQPGTNDGTGSAARFTYPYGVAVDSSTNVYVADQGNYTIRKITPAGVVTTIAGSPGQSGSANGVGSNAQFNSPYSVAVDNSGNLYVADTWNNTIRKIIPGGFVSTLAGDPTQFGSNDGAGGSASFNLPSSIALDTAGNLYVTDSANFTIRKVTPAGVVSTLAGSAGQSGSADGVGSTAHFFYPNGIALDSTGRMYIGDTSNNRVTKGLPLFQFQKSNGPTIFGGSFHTFLTGPFGSNAVLETSANLQTWAPVQTNLLLPDGLSLSVPTGTNQRLSLRARLAP